MQIQSATRDDPDRHAPLLATIAEKFNIYHAKGSSKAYHGPESRLLAIQYVVYDTLVTGIHSAIRDPDFKGAILTDYELHGEEYHIVFAMWYSQTQQLYFLTSLGQYSSGDYRRGMRRFKTENQARLQIKLAPIHAEGLVNLKEKLARSNLSGANVCLIEDSLESGRTAYGPKTH
ncbi:MAG: hypothetical protein ACU843_09570 [Gammaproteobacteria bacterium]